MSEEISADEVCYLVAGFLRNRYPRTYSRFTQEWRGMDDISLPANKNVKSLHHILNEYVQLKKASTMQPISSNNQVMHSLRNVERTLNHVVGLLNQSTSSMSVNHHRNHDNNSNNDNIIPTSPIMSMDIEAFQKLLDSDYPTLLADHINSISMASPKRQTSQTTTTTIAPRTSSIATTTKNNTNRRKSKPVKRKHHMLHNDDNEEVDDDQNNNEQSAVQLPLDAILDAISHDPRAEAHHKDLVWNINDNDNDSNDDNDDINDNTHKKRKSLFDDFNSKKKNHKKNEKNNSSPKKKKQKIIIEESSPRERSIVSRTVAIETEESSDEEDNNHKHQRKSTRKLSSRHSKKTTITSPVKEQERKQQEEEHDEKEFNIETRTERMNKISNSPNDMETHGTHVLNNLLHEEKEDTHDNSATEIDQIDHDTIDDLLNLAHNSTPKKKRYSANNSKRMSPRKRMSPVKLARLEALRRQGEEEENQIISIDEIKKMISSDKRRNNNNNNVNEGIEGIEGILPLIKKDVSVEELLALVHS